MAATGCAGPHSTSNTGGRSPPHRVRRGRPSEESRLRSPLFSTGMIEVGVQSRNVAYHSWTLSILCCTSACRGRCDQWQITTILPARSGTDENVGVIVDWPGAGAFHGLLSFVQSQRDDPARIIRPSVPPAHITLEIMLGILIEILHFDGIAVRGSLASKRRVPPVHAFQDWRSLLCRAGVDWRRARRLGNGTASAPLPGARFPQGLRFAGTIASCLRRQLASSISPIGLASALPKKWSGRGRPAKRTRRDAGRQPTSVKNLALNLRSSARRKITWREGAAAPLSSRFARVRVRVAHRDYTLTESRSEEWLLIEWPKGEAEPTKYWLSTLPEDISFHRLADYAKLRWLSGASVARRDLRPD